MPRFSSTFVPESQLLETRLIVVLERTHGDDHRGSPVTEFFLCESIRDAIDNVSDFFTDPMQEQAGFFGMDDYVRGQITAQKIDIYCDQDNATEQEIYQSISTYWRHYLKDSPHDAKKQYVELRGHTTDD
jgi:hypothetical protein